MWTLKIESVLKKNGGVGVAGKCSIVVLLNIIFLIIFFLIHDNKNYYIIIYSTIPVITTSFLFGFKYGAINFIFLEIIHFLVLSAGNQEQMGFWNNRIFMSGAIICIVSYLVSLNKKTEERLEEERDFFRQIIENMPDGLYLKSADDRRIIILNKEMEKIISTKIEEALGKTVFYKD